MEDNWVSIFSSDKPWQTEIAKQVLAENGIEAVIINKQDSSYRSFGDVEVYVAQNDVEKSKEILKNIES
ncbi:MAG: DUF2007 domain-containing protein [Bacteroidales bacterium]|nr:DUF2007 domain-containing protein [Bacteroidales bacterium]